MLALLAVGVARAEPERIPGTRVQLEVPDGFVLSDEFPGLGRSADLTSVLVTELAAPIEHTNEAFSRDALAERGVDLHRSAAVMVGSHPGTLLHATQRAAGTTFRKWLLLFGDGGASVLITATTPLDLESTHGETLVGVLRSARWEPAREVTPGEGLRFRIRGAAPFEVVTTAPNAVVLADPNHDGAGDEVPPLIAVGSSLGQVHIADLAAFSRQRLLETATLDQIELRSERERKLGGLAAHEATADARDTESQRAVRVTHIVATDGERYFLVQGIFDAARPDAHSAAFEQVIASFEPIETP
jgi:hypothetical protein